MDGVLDFLILDSVYKSSVQQVWKEGDRFQSLIDGTYWRGTVLERKPFRCVAVVSVSFRGGWGLDSQLPPAYIVGTEQLNVLF